jgi:hypothetical protein
MITGHQLKTGYPMNNNAMNTGVPKRLNTSGSSAMQAASSGNNSTAKHVMKMIKHNNGNNSMPTDLHAANLGNIVPAKAPKQLNFQMSQSHPLKSDAIANVALSARQSVAASVHPMYSQGGGSSVGGARRGIY